MRMRRLLSLLCAMAMLAVLIPVGALPVSAGKTLVHRTETTLLEEILERDGFIEGIWYPWFTHEYLGCGLTSNELAAKWLNGWSGITNCWYDFTKVGFDEHGPENIYREIYNLKSLGYNLLGYEGSIYGEGVIYDNTGDVIGIKQEYLYNVRRFLDLCRAIDMPVLWTVTCHSSSVNHYYTNGKIFWDMACRYYSEKTVADHYAERFVKPLCKVLAEYDDVVAMVAVTSEAENEINDSQVGNAFASREMYGVDQDHMLYFVNAVNEAVKASFPAVPRTICCQLSDMSMYSEVDFDMLGDQNYNYAGRSDPIDAFRSPVPMFVSEFGLGDSLYYEDAELTKLQLTFRKNFRSTGYQGCVMWCWSPDGTSGSAYDLLKKGAKTVTDFRSTAYDLYYYFEEQRDIHRGDETVLDTPQLFCNVGDGLIEWVAPRQGVKLDILRSDDGGKTWKKEVNNADVSKYFTGYKGQYRSTATPTENTVYQVVVRDDKGNEKKSQVSNSVKDMRQFNTKYSGANEEKTFDLGTYPLVQKNVSTANPMILTATGADRNRPSSASVNLIKDGSFESSACGFTTGSTLKVVSDSTAPNGKKSLLFDTRSTTQADWHIIWIEVEKYTDYTFSAWVKGAYLSADNRGYASLGVVDEATKRFIPYNTGKVPFYTQYKQIMPTAWDEEWHLRSVCFNSQNRTKVGIAVYGCSTQMWVDDMALFTQDQGIKYQSANMAQLVSTRFDVEYTYCAEKNNVFKNATFDQKSSNFWQTGSGWKSGFLSIANSKYEYGASLKYTATANPVGMQYLKWVDVQPNTWYTFSADVKVLKDGDGSLILIDGKMRDPGTIIAVEFDKDTYGDGWSTVYFRLNTGCFTKLAVGVADGGGSALIDNLRLFKTADGIQGDDTYIDPNTGNTVAPPTATVKPTTAKTTAGSSAVEGTTSATAPVEGETTLPSDTVTDPTEAQPSQGEETAPTEGDGAVQDADGKAEKKSDVPWPIIGIGAGALVLLAGGVVLFLVLRKKKT